MGRTRTSRTALVTGAARGIGANLAGRLVDRGMNVALVDVRADELRATAVRLGPRALPLVADVTDRDALAVAVATARDRFSRIDTVVANAGVAPAEPVAGAGAGSLRTTLEVNAIGVANTIDACLPALVEQDGYVLVVGSLAATVHLPLMGAYAASKAAVDTYADVLRLELTGSGVDVGVACFGFVDTELLREGIASPPAASLARRARLLFAHTLDVDEAGSALVDAIRRRSRRVVRPRWLWPVVLAPGVFAPAMERYIEWVAVPALAEHMEPGGGGRG